MIWWRKNDYSEEEDDVLFAEPPLEQAIQIAKPAMWRMARQGGTIEQAQDIIREAFN
jgi:hypothetical protein